MSGSLSATSRALDIPELLGEVLANLDKVDLARSARVSQQWRTLSERVLYGALSTEYDVEDEIGHVRSLIRTLLNRPDLARRVTHLQVIVDVDDPAPVQSISFQLTTRLLTLYPAMTCLSVDGKSGSHT